MSLPFTLVMVVVINVIAVPPHTSVRQISFAWGIQIHFIIMMFGIPFRDGKALLSQAFYLVSNNFRDVFIQISMYSKQM